jgi:hypothetical protein
VSQVRLVARQAALALAALSLTEWFLFRLVSRFAAAPTLEGLPRTIIEIVGQVGLFLVSPSFLLTALLLYLCALLAATAGPERPTGLRLALAFFIAVFVSLALAHTFLAKTLWIDVSFNIVSWLAVAWLALLFAARPAAGAMARLGVLLIVIAYSGHYIYVLEQLVGGISDANRGGSAGLAVAIRDLGELAAVAAAGALFAATSLPAGEWRRRRRWLLPLFLGLVVAAGSIADAAFNQGFTAVFATWSLGFNMVWPWPLYALALTLFAYSVLTCFSPGLSKGLFANRNTGLGLLFLFVAGYELKVPYQHLLALLSLLLLTGLFRPLAGEVPDTSLFPEEQVRPVVRNSSGVTVSGQEGAINHVPTDRLC